tara:strand:- start:450 stop:716 length:267 start_codon:yes stop_codon:yes gene_type:complete
VNEDWFDELHNGEPTSITDTQWFIIESNIRQTSLPSNEVFSILNNLHNFTEIEAEEIIKLINLNKIETDTRQQWIKMLKDGVFGCRNS